MADARKYVDRNKLLICVHKRVLSSENKHWTTKSNDKIIEEGKLKGKISDDFGDRKYKDKQMSEGKSEIIQK